LAKQTQVLSDTRVYTKRCSQCKKTKAASEFSFRSDRPGKLRAQCRKCCVARSIAWNKRNPEKVRQVRRAYAARNYGRRHKDTPTAAKVRETRALTSTLAVVPDDAHTRWLKSQIKARRRKLSGTLDAAWLAKWAQVRSCPILGIPFMSAGTRLNNAPHPLTPSLDRLDPSLGYTPENTRVVSYFVNVSKNAWPDDQYRLLTMVAANNMRH